MKGRKSEKEKGKRWMETMVGMGIKKVKVIESKKRKQKTKKNFFGAYKSKAFNIDKLK
jgi:hypothetical protein